MNAIAYNLNMSRERTKTIELPVPNWTFEAAPLSGWGESDYPGAVPEECVDGDDTVALEIPNW